MARILRRQSVPRRNVTYFSLLASWCNLCERSTTEAKNDPVFDELRYRHSSRKQSRRSRSSILVGVFSLSIAKSSSSSEKLKRKKEKTSRERFESERNAYDREAEMN